MPLARSATALFFLICTFHPLGLAQAFFTPTDFGQVAVGGNAPATQTLTFQLSGLSAQPSFRMHYGLEFSAGIAACSSDWTTCTLPVSFTPNYPGLRQDAVVVKDTSGNLLGTGFVHGMGVGPQATLVPGLLSLAYFAHNTPAAVALDAAGSLYIADSSLKVVAKVEAGTGTVTTIAGIPELGLGSSGDGGPATSAKLNHPNALAIDAAGISI